jgi:hypothetical protein
MQIQYNRFRDLHIFGTLMTDTIKHVDRLMIKLHAQLNEYEFQLTEEEKRDRRRGFEISLNIW